MNSGVDPVGQLKPCPDGPLEQRSSEIDSLKEVNATGAIIKDPVLLA